MLHDLMYQSRLTTRNVEILLVKTSSEVSCLSSCLVEKGMLEGLYGSPLVRFHESTPSSLNSNLTE